MARNPGEEAFGFPALDLGNERLHSILEAYLKKQVPSLLFVGADGVGKEYIALDFARRICCESDPACQLGGELCGSCRKAVRFEHPSIHIVYPTPSRGGAESGDDDATDIGRILEEKRRDIFATYRFSRKVSIRIARARAIIQRANTKPFGSSHNVFVIMDAHAMREEAQNALLKLIEEPPESSILVLVTSNVEAILYTIRSRCQQVRFSPLKTAVVEKVLMDHYGIEAKAARRSATLARGSIKRAREIVASYSDAEREAAYDFIAHVIEEPESRIVARALGMSRGASRDGAALFLHELSLAFRDIMSGDKTLYVNQDQAGFVSSQASRWDRRTLPWILDRISGTRRGILHRNLNIDAALVDLFLAIKRAGC